MGRPNQSNIRKQEYLEHFKQSDNGMTIAELVELTGHNYFTVGKDVKELENAEIITKRGRIRNGSVIYYATKAGSHPMLPIGDHMVAVSDMVKVWLEQEPPG